MMKSVFIVGFVLWVLPAAVLSQQQKVGYVNTDEILAEIPEYDGIDQQLRTQGQQWRNELREIQAEIDTLEAEYEAREILYTDELREEKQEEIRQKEQEYEEFQNQKFGPDGEYFTVQQELLEPIQRKIFEAINRVADEEGFDFVFDRAGNTSLLHADTEWNLNEQVLLELGIEEDE